MENMSPKTMVATVPAADCDNSPIIELGDGLTIQTHKRLDHNDIENGVWVIVRNPNIRRGLYLVRQYWRTKDGAWLVAGNPAVPGHMVSDQDAIDGIILEIHKAEPEQSVAYH